MHQGVQGAPPTGAPELNESEPEATAAAHPIWSSAERRLTKVSNAMSLQSNGMGFVSLILRIS